MGVGTPRPASPSGGTAATGVGGRRPVQVRCGTRQVDVAQRLTAFALDERAPARIRQPRFAFAVALALVGQDGPAGVGRVQHVLEGLVSCSLAVLTLSLRISL